MCHIRWVRQVLNHLQTGHGHHGRHAAESEDQVGRVQNSEQYATGRGLGSAQRPQAQPVVHTQSGG